MHADTDDKFSQEYSVSNSEKSLIDKWGLLNRGQCEKKDKELGLECFKNIKMEKKYNKDMNR